MRLGRIDDVICWMILWVESEHVFLDCQLLSLLNWSFSSHFGICKAIQVLGGTLPNCWQRMTRLRTFYCFVAAWHYGKWWDLWNWLAETAALLFLSCCYVIISMLFHGCSYREISGTKAVKLRYIQATYTDTELHCSDTSNCKDWAEVALSRVEDSRQLSQFSRKGVFFWTERWNFTAKCQRIFGVWPLESSFSLWRTFVQHGWEERFWKVKLGGVQDMEHVVILLFFRSKLRADWTQFFKGFKNMKTLKLNLRVFAPCMVILEAFAMAGSDN